MSLCEEELRKDIDSLDGDWDYGWRRHDVEAAKVDNTKCMAARHLPHRNHDLGVTQPFEVNAIMHVLNSQTDNYATARAP